MKLKRPDGVVVGDGTAYLQLKQAGDTGTGKAGCTSDDVIEVQNGKADGETLTFQVRENSDAPLMVVTLTLKGDELIQAAVVYTTGSVRRSCGLA